MCRARVWQMTTAGGLVMVAVGISGTSKETKLLGGHVPLLAVLTNTLDAEFTAR